MKIALGLTFAAFAALAAIALAQELGDGGNGDGAEPARGSGPPRATESLGEFTQTFEDAVAIVRREADCRDYVRLLVNPADFSELECRRLVLRTYGDPLTVDGVKQFGPVALMETRAEKGSTSTFALAAGYDGRWRIVQQYKPSPGDQPLDEDAATDVAETYVEAIRQEDCDTVLDNMKLGRATPEEVCAGIEEGTAAEAFQDADTEVQSLGGNEFIRAYGISLEDEGWFNFFILDMNGDPTVMDFSLAPRSARPAS